MDAVEVTLPCAHPFPLYECISVDATETRRVDLSGGPTGGEIKKMEAPESHRLARGAQGCGQPGAPLSLNRPQKEPAILFPNTITKHTHLSTTSSGRKRF